MTSARGDAAVPLKARQQAMWASGDFAVIGSTLQIVGELLCEAVDLCAGESVLDVAGGNGNATLAAARRLAAVTSTDIVPALLERGRRRADAEGFAVTFDVADAAALPYAAELYDVVLSTFGVRFAPDHQQAARELRRVCRPGGRIALASWTPVGSSAISFASSAATYQGPCTWAFASLDAARQRTLEAEMGALLRDANEGGTTSLVVPGEYLETVITV